MFETVLGVRTYKSYQSLPKDLSSFYRIAEMKFPYEWGGGKSIVESETSKVASALSPVKRSAIAGQMQARPVRSGLRKSNEVTLHLSKPDWVKSDLSDTLVFSPYNTYQLLFHVNDCVLLVTSQPNSSHRA